MTDPAIRTEADLRAEIESMNRRAEATCIGLYIAELSDLGFGSVTLYDWQRIDPTYADGLSEDYHYSYSTRRYSVEGDVHTLPTGSDSLPAFCVDVTACGPTPAAAMASLLSEARTKAAPK